LDGHGVYALINQAEVADHPLAVLNTRDTGKKDFAISAVAGLPWVRRSPTPFVLVGSLLFILILGISGRLSNSRGILFMGTHLLVIAALWSTQRKPPSIM
jgi:hypothetical protein